MSSQKKHDLPGPLDQNPLLIIDPLGGVDIPVGIAYVKSDLPGRHGIQKSERRAKGCNDEEQ